jgi:trimethylamine--corrinoid protein Co-methyltransferase
LNTLSSAPFGRRGRDARAGARAAQPAPPVVWPGLAGGAYRPLSEADIARIHGAALEVLERIGMGEAQHEKLLAYALPRGCVLEGGRLKFPRSLVEDMLAVNASSVVAYGIDPRHDLEIRPRRLHIATSGEAVTILDYERQRYRPSTLVDLYDAARLVDQLEHIHAFGQPFIASEHSDDALVHDLNAAYAALSGTRKSISLGVSAVANVDPLIRLFDTFVGREGGFLQRPFCVFGGCPVLSPLRWAHDNLDVMIRMAELGLAADVAIAAQAGATAPAALAGALVQTFAETLACLVVCNIVRPGAAIHFGMWPFISDLRTGAFTGGSGEEALITACTVQLCNHYGLISSVPSGMTDAKTVDAQYGYEKALTTLAAALAGPAWLSPYPGVVGSLLGQSFEGLVVDNDMLGAALRVVKGVEVNDDTLSFDVIRDAVLGPGHFLGSEQTLRLMRSEYLYPRIGDRRSAGEWEEKGSEGIYAQAHRRVGQLLSSHYPDYIDPATDARLRAAFPIRLRPEDKRPGNGRW